MIVEPSQLFQALTAAILLPLGLLLSLAVVRALAIAFQAVARLRPLPIVVHPLNFEHGIREFVPPQQAVLLEIPSRIRDFIAEDVTLGGKLAPGPVSPVAPPLSSAVPPESSQSLWAQRLAELIYPRVKPAYNLILIPEVPARGIALGAQIVETPRNKLVAAHSFQAVSVSDIVLQVGSFCIETVLEQPGVLRRSPRWEHWRPGAYAAFRAGYSLQQKGAIDDAHAAYQRAAALAPGNARIALHHASLHESTGRFREAVATYNATSCLWRQNVDISYRLSAAAMNHILTTSATPAISRRVVLDANRILDNARIRLTPLQLLRRLARTFRPRLRDPGERRYWYAWMRPDPYRSPLKLLRRSKSFEYRGALAVAAASNLILLYINGREAHHKNDPRPHVLLRTVLKIATRKRSGWLAHWSAACFFSRAMEISERCRPELDEWSRDHQRVRDGSIMRFQLAFEPELAPDSTDDWKAYCSERAVAELAKVLRNPCNQLDQQLLHHDPDIKRLHSALSGKLVEVLAGLGGEPEESIATTTEGYPSYVRSDRISARSFWARARRAMPRPYRG